MNETTANRSRVDVGLTIRQARRSLGIKQAEAAFSVGHTESWLSKIESGALPLDKQADITALATMLVLPPEVLTCTDPPASGANRRPPTMPAGRDTRTIGRMAVYRLYSSDDVLLYVGITKRFGSRWEQHARIQPWWPHVDHQTIYWVADREAALRTEKAAMEAEKPVYNIWGSPWRGGTLDDGTGFYVLPKETRREAKGVHRAPRPQLRTSV